MSAITHSLTLDFGRVLSEAEWREIVEKAKALPYVQGLHAHTGDTAPCLRCRALDQRCADLEGQIVDFLRKEREHGGEAQKG